MPDFKFRDLYSKITHFLIASSNSNAVVSTIRMNLCGCLAGEGRLKLLEWLMETEVIALAIVRDFKLSIIS